MAEESPADRALEEWCAEPFGELPIVFDHEARAKVVAAIDYLRAALDNRFELGAAIDEATAVLADAKAYLAYLPPEE